MDCTTGLSNHFMPSLRHWQANTDPYESVASTEQPSDESSTDSGEPQPNPPVGSQTSY